MHLIHQKHMQQVSLPVNQEPLAPESNSPSPMNSLMKEVNLMPASIGIRPKRLPFLDMLDETTGEESPLKMTEGNVLLPFDLAQPTSRLSINDSPTPACRVSE